MVARVLLALFVLHAFLGEQSQGLFSASGSRPLFPCNAERARLEERSERPPLFRAGMDAGAVDGHVLSYSGGCRCGVDDGDVNGDGNVNGDGDGDGDGNGNGNGDTCDTVVGLPGGDRDLQTRRLKAERGRRGVQAGRRFSRLPLLAPPLELRGGASSVGDDDDDGHGMRWRETARGKQGQEGSRKGPKLGRGERTAWPRNHFGICNARNPKGGTNFCRQQPSTLQRSD